MECSVRGILNRIKVNRFNAKLAVTRCESFVAILTFRDAVGMASEFNTFRLSGAWAKRVAPGDVVALQHAAGDLIGYAKVVETHAGKFRDMEREFGINNHMVIDAEVRGESCDLAKVMTECYGGHRFNPEGTVSVIELRRIDGIGEEGAS